jgi:hypothetical protein
MAKDNYGSDGQVQNEKYCMKDSWQAKNVDETNAAMGFEDMSDLANTARPPTPVRAASRNEQLGSDMPKTAKKY